MGDRLGFVAAVFSREIERFDVVAYTDPAPAGMHFLRDAEMPIPKEYAELEDMLANESLDLLMIGSPNSFHFEHIRAALDAGVRVFCEKPVVTTERQTYDTLGLLREYGEDQVTVGLVLRYAPLYQDLVRTIRRGDLGTVISIEASEHIPPDHGAFFMRDWRRHSELSGGFMLEKCCHDLDLYAGVTQSRPSRVSSFGGRRMYTGDNADLEKEAVYHEWASLWNGTDTVFDTDADIIDNQTALIEYQNGVNMCFHTNLHVPDAFRRFCVVGSRGMAEGDFVRAYLRTHNSVTKEKELDLSYESYEYGEGGHFGAEEIMAEMLSANFSDGAPLPVSVVNALEAGITAIKIDEARTSGNVVSMESVWQRFADYGF